MYYICKSVYDCLYEQNGCYELDYEFIRYKDALKKKKELENSLSKQEKKCIEYYIEKDGELFD